MTQKRPATQAGEGVGAGTCGMRAISVLAALHIAPHSLTSATLCPIAQAVGYVREICGLGVCAAERFENELAQDELRPQVI